VHIVETIFLNKLKGRFSVTWRRLLW